MGQELEKGSVQFSHSVTSDCLWPHELQHTMPLCPSPTSRIHPNPCPSSQWCHPAFSLSETLLDQQLHFLLSIFYWSIVGLQCCVCFLYTAKQFSFIYILYTHTHIYIHFQILSHYTLLQDIYCSSLCHTIRPCCLSSLYTEAWLC